MKKIALYVLLVAVASVRERSDLHPIPGQVGDRTWDKRKRERGESCCALALG